MIWVQLVTLSRNRNMREPPGSMRNLLCIAMAWFLWSIWQAGKLWTMTQICFSRFYLKQTTIVMQLRIVRKAFHLALPFFCNRLKVYEMKCAHTYSKFIKIIREYIQHKNCSGSWENYINCYIIKLSEN